MKTFLLSLFLAVVAFAQTAAPDLSFLPRTVGEVEIIAWDGYSYVGHGGRTYWSGSAAPSAADLDDAVADPRTPPAPAIGIWSPLVFIERFTQAEQLAIFESDDPAVLLFRAKAMAAREIRSDDPRTVAGMELLVAKGVLTAERKTAILTP